MKCYVINLFLLQIYISPNEPVISIYIRTILLRQQVANKYTGNSLDVVLILPKRKSLFTEIMTNTSKQYQYSALTCENDIVSVLQEFPGLPIPKIHRLCSLPTQLQHAAIRVGRLGTKKFDTFVCMKN